MPTTAFIWKVVHLFSVNILRIMFYKRGKKPHLSLTGRPVQSFFFLCQRPCCRTLCCLCLLGNHRIYYSSLSCISFLGCSVFSCQCYSAHQGGEEPVHQPQRCASPVPATGTKKHLPRAQVGSRSLCPRAAAGQ